MPPSIDKGSAASVAASVATVVRTKPRGGGQPDKDKGHPAERTTCIAIVGDPPQLAPSAGMEYQSEAMPMGVSVYERMARFGTPLVTLSVQYRIRPLLWSFVSGSVFPRH